MKKEKNNFTDLDILNFIKFADVVQLDQSLTPLLDKAIEEEKLKEEEKEQK